MKESESLLQRFFDASLIPSDTTDERLTHYQAAAADLAKRFGEIPHDAVSASRVAIDPSCPASEPWFNTVQDAVKVHWKTFLANNYDGPRQICRAILLEAMSKSAEKDWNITLSIWNATSSLLPHLGNGPEQTITRQFVCELGDECEAESSSQWRIDKTVDESVPEFEIKLPAIKATPVDEAELTNGMSDAAGPNDPQNKSHGNPNPHWSNQAQSWSYQFAPRAANAIAKSVNKALAGTSPAIKGFGDQLAPALKKYVHALSKWVVGSAQRSERFTALLWWKQAMYSPSLQCGYRDLSPVCTAIAASFDLPAVSGAPVPLSVEYFFREIIRSVVTDNPKCTLADLIAASKNVNKMELCLPPVPSGPARRISLREFLSLARHGTPSDEMIPAYLGVAPTTSLPISEWAVWLLRDRLAEILTAPKP